MARIEVPKEELADRKSYGGLCLPTESEEPMKSDADEFRPHTESESEPEPPTVKKSKTNGRQGKGTAKNQPGTTRKQFAREKKEKGKEFEPKAKKRGRKIVESEEESEVERAPAPKRVRSERIQLNRALAESRAAVKPAVEDPKHTRKRKGRIPAPKKKQDEDGFPSGDELNVSHLTKEQEEALKKKAVRARAAKLEVLLPVVKSASIVLNPEQEYESDGHDSGPDEVSHLPVDRSLVRYRPRGKTYAEEYPKIYGAGGWGLREMEEAAREDEILWRALEEQLRREAEEASAAKE